MCIFTQLKIIGKLFSPGIDVFVNTFHGGVLLLKLELFTPF